jgi:hypothetical protein
VGAVVLIGLRAANTKGKPPGGTPVDITEVGIADAANGSRFAAPIDEETTSCARCP